MTESEWLACRDPAPMLEFLRWGDGMPDGTRGGGRKPRLFAVACCRRQWHLLTDERSRRAVKTAERCADGLASNEERRAACVAAHEAKDQRQHVPSWAAAWAASTAPYQAAERAVRFSGVELPDQADILRDLYGTILFRSVTLDPSWLRWNDATVPKIAQGIYEERAFGRLPILADALLDAGCDNEDILSHCRGPGPHVRGCWVVDLILGRN